MPSFLAKRPAAAFFDPSARDDKNLLRRVRRDGGVSGLQYDGGRTHSSDTPLPVLAARGGVTGKLPCPARTLAFAADADAVARLVVASLTIQPSSSGRRGAIGSAGRKRTGLGGMGGGSVNGPDEEVRRDGEEGGDALARRCPSGTF